MGREQETYQEFYIMLFADQLQINNKDSIREQQYEVSVSLLDNFGKTVSSNSWITSVNLTEIDSILNRFVIYDQWKESITPLLIPDFIKTFRSEQSK